MDTRIRMKYLWIRNTGTKEEMLLLTIHNTSREQSERAKRLSLSHWIGLLGLPVVLGLPSRNKEYFLHLLLYRKKKLDSGTDLDISLQCRFKKEQFLPFVKKYLERT